METNNKELENRIRKGIAYFRDIKPSKWNYSNTVHLKLLLELMEKYINGGEEKPTSYEAAKEVFETEEGRQLNQEPA